MEVDKSTSTSSSKRNKRRSSRSRSRSPSRSTKHSSNHSKHRSSRDKDEDKKERRKHRRDEGEGEDKEKEKDRKRHRSSREHTSSSRRHRHREGDKDDVDVDFEVIEEDLDKPTDYTNTISTIPTSSSLPLRSSVIPTHPTLPLPSDGPLQTSLKPDHRPQLDLRSHPDDSVSHFRPGESTGRSRPLDAEAEFTDGYGAGEVGDGGSAEVDLFSAMGTERKRRPTKREREREERGDPDRPMISRREINREAFGEDGRKKDSAVPVAGGGERDRQEGEDKKRDKIVPGGAGSAWRMAKLRRVYETAEEEGRDVHEVGIERYGSREGWEEALEERRILDEREGRRRDRNLSGRSHDSSSNSASQARQPSGTPQFIFNDPTRSLSFNSASGSSSRPSSRAGFRRPGNRDSLPGTPQGQGPSQSQSRAAGTGTGAGTPIPSVFTPQMNLIKRPSGLSNSVPLDSNSTPSTSASAGDPRQLNVSQPPLSPTSLNRLQARVLKAKLMGGGGAEELEREYEREERRARQGDGGGGLGGEGAMDGGGGGGGEVRVLPTLDGRGRLYDVGVGKTGEGDEGRTSGPGNRRKKKEPTFETRDSKTGDLIRYNADDDTQTLSDLIREERFGGGSSSTKDMDTEYANRIATDAKFEDDLEYLDDRAENLARKKMKTDAMKRAFAIGDFAKTKKILDECAYCYQDDRPPRSGVIAMGTRAYLTLPDVEELVEGHALIAPLQHHLSCLEADEDTWEEIKNFMKTLMQMYAAQDKGVVFCETVVNLKWQKHAAIEVIPVPFESFDLLPGYFKEAIVAAGAEWSQHKKLINFADRPGGFRRSLVPNLPYFAVMWSYKGDKGYGHVIESADGPTGGGLVDGNAEKGGDQRGDAYDIDENSLGGKPGEVGKWFAREVIGDVVGAEMRKWRRPRRLGGKEVRERAERYKKEYEKWDWTKALQ